MPAPSRIDVRRPRSRSRFVAARGLIAGAAVIAAAAAVAPPAGAALSATATASPFALAFEDGGRAVVAERAGSGPGTRVRFVLADGSAHTLTTLTSASGPASARTYAVATDAPGRSATVTTTQRADGGIGVSAAIFPADGVRSITVSLAAARGDRFLGGGARAMGVDLAATAVPLKVSFVPSVFSGFYQQSGRPQPFATSSAGWGVLRTGDAVGSMAFPGAPAQPAKSYLGDQVPCPTAPRVDAVQLCSKGATLGYELWAGPPRRTLAAITARIGRAPAPSDAQLGITRYRDTAVRGTADVDADVAQLGRLGIPLATILIDNPWEQPVAGAQTGISSACIGSFRWDRSRFPDPAALARRLHARGIRLMVWAGSFVAVDPGCPAPGYPAGSLLPRTGSAATNTNRQDLDFTRPATAAAFRARLAAAMRATGIDGIKADRGDETDFESRTLTGGPGVQTHNAITRAYDEAVAGAVADAGGSELVTRAGWLGSQRLLGGTWTGDQEQTFGGLADALRIMLTNGVSGYPYTAVEVGGYHPKGAAFGVPVPKPTTPTAELLLRWAQAGALSPAMIIGGAGRLDQALPYQRPVLRQLAGWSRLHAALLPVRRSLAREHARDGLPLARPVGLTHPGDPAAAGQDTTFLLGDDLFAAPVLTGNDVKDVRAVPQQQRFRLPRGAWVDLFAGRTARGGRVRRSTPLGELALYARDGSAIPFDARVPMLWSSPWPADGGPSKRRAGWLVALGRARSASASDPAAGRLRVRRSGATLRIAVRGGRSETQVLLAGPLGGIERITAGGRTLRLAASAARLRTARSGWRRVREPFPAIAVKLP